MDFIMMSIFVTLGLLIICFACYAVMTNSVIKDQEKQIAKLRTENFRMAAAMKHRQRVKVVEIHDSRIDEKNIPEFNNI